MSKVIPLSQLHKKRILLVGGILLGCSAIMGLILFALNQNINLYYTPTQIVDGEAPQERRIRVGGMVVADSLQRKNGLSLEFVITDYTSKLPVSYTGILPALFGEGQGMVAFGRVEKNRFIAEEILAKHDEKYMPKEVADMIKSVTN